MTAARWQAIEEIFTTAAELSGPAREEYLDAATAGDASLRREVMQLLQADSGERTATRLRMAVESGAQDLLAARRQPPDGISGRRIGPWRVTGVVGQGGMGSVYRAERDDDRFRKQVAIKILRQGLESDFALARFRYERRILGALEHANIARMIDGGEMDGQPYIVMEFVEGLPVTQYCLQRQLNTEDIVRLFRQVCEAVQYAHLQMVIHRDLKPSNILVTAEGTVKLLDFGIARLEDPDLLPETAARTATGMHLMTPEYASPEQVRGETAAVASDVYALGTVLFELLTNVKAQRLSTHDPAELLRVVCEEEVVPASAAAGAERRKELAGDLDNIVARALRKDPARRYSSVEQFSTDLRLFLEGRPVIARADTAAYRFGKFLRRNRLAAVLVSFLAVSLIAGTAISMWQARRAERRFQQVRGLAHALLFDVDGEMENLSGTTKAREVMVSTAAAYLNSLSADAAGDRGLSLELAEAYQKVGDVLGNPDHPNLGRRDEALRNYAKSVSLANSVSRGAGDMQAARLIAWGEVKAGYVGANPERLKRGLALAMPLGHADSELLMEAHRSLGDAYVHSDGWLTALREYEACLRAAATPLAKPLAQTTEEMRLNCLQRAAKAQAATGDLDGALARFGQAAAQLRERARLFPGNTATRINLGHVLIELGRWTGNPSNPSLGDRKGAATYFGEARDLARQLVAEDTRNEAARRLQIATLVALAETGWAPDPAALRGWIGEASALAARLPQAADRTAYAAMLLGAQARMLDDAGRASEARAALAAQRKDLESLRQGDYDRLSSALDVRLAIAHTYASSGQNREAHLLYLREIPAVETLLKLRPDDFYEVALRADIYSMLARTETATRAEAAGWAERGVAVWAAWETRNGGSSFTARRRQAAEALARSFGELQRKPQATQPPETTEQAPVPRQY